MSLSIPPKVSAETIQKPGVGRNDDLWNTALQLETSFLSEMLKNTGLAKTSASFGGGVGEAQFSSLMVDQHAKSLVDGGGIGLAEAVFKSLQDQVEK